MHFYAVCALIKLTKWERHSKHLNFHVLVNRYIFTVFTRGDNLYCLLFATLENKSVLK